MTLFREADPSALLARLYREDREDHAAVPPVGTPEYDALRERDRGRRDRAAAAIVALESGAADGPSPADLYHAAWLFNHGDAPEDALRAHRWALAAAERGHGPARWLAAASYDRWCMYEGRPQRYGTQFVPDGTRYRLWDLEPGTTDEERATWDVPPLAEQERRAREMTAREPQPDMAGAPPWLKAALARWAAEEPPARPSSDALPRFTYHPDPVRTGAFVPSDAACRCCGRPRGWISNFPVYAEEEGLDDALCPWCVADGSAAGKFEAEFVDAYALEAADVPSPVIEEVCRRTPGYASWQSQRWLSHCGDACEFHGDPPKDRVAGLPDAVRRDLLAELPVSWTWDVVVSMYEPGGQPAIYWFICRHCGESLYYADHH